MSDRVSYDGVVYSENDDGGSASVTVIFETERFGFYQIEVRMRDEYQLSELTNEPNLNVFPKEDQMYVVNICTIACRLLKEAPSHQRFHSS